MEGASSISSAVSHDSKANDLKTLFARGLDFQTADHDLINNYIVHGVNQYAATNLEDWSLWDSIQMDFAKFEAKHFDELDNDTWGVIGDYCYLHGFWVDYNFGPGRNCTTTMLKAVEADWNNKWTLEQIEWVEERYHSLSRTTRKQKQQLTGIPNSDSTSNLETNTQNIWFQTPLQRLATTQPLYPVMLKQSPYVYQLIDRPQYEYEPQCRPNKHQPAPTWINPAPPTSKMTAMDVGQYNIRNRRNNHQPVPTWIFNPTPPTSKFWKNCEYIPERSAIPTPPACPAQIPPVQAPPIQTLPAQVPAIQAPLVPAPLT